MKCTIQQHLETIPDHLFAHTAWGQIIAIFFFFIIYILFFAPRDKHLTGRPPSNLEESLARLRQEAFMDTDKCVQGLRRSRGHKTHR